MFYVNLTYCGLFTGTRIQTPNWMATLYCAGTVPIAQTLTRIPFQIWILSWYCTRFWDRYPSPSPAMKISHYIHLILCSESTSDRYYMALYRKMLDPALKSSSKQPMFLNLLYKSMKKDISDRRVQVKLVLISRLHLMF